MPWITFVLGLLLTALPFAARLYYLMPGFGTQRHDHLRTAYLFHQATPWLVVIGVVLAALSAVRIVQKAPSSRSRTVRALVLALLIGGALWGVRTMLTKTAPHLFRVPETIAFAEGDLDALAEKGLPPETLVLGLRAGGETKAYPIRLLAYHHHLRDEVGGVSVWVTYCSMCRTGKIFSPRVGDRELDFEVVGANRFNSMYRDEQTGTWWYQANGKAVMGELEGEVLTELPSDQTTLERWLEAYPESLVFLPDPEASAGYAMFGFDRWDGQRDREQAPPEWRWVVGVSQGGVSRAYSWSEVSGDGLIQDVVGGLPIAIHGLSDGVTHRVWDRRIDGRVADFTLDEDRMLVDPVSGTRFGWDGLGHEGELAGTSLEQIPSTVEYRHSFVGFNDAESWEPPPGAEADEGAGEVAPEETSEDADESDQDEG